MPVADGERRRVLLKGAGGSFTAVCECVCRYSGFLKEVENVDFYSQVLQCEELSANCNLKPIRWKYTIFASPGSTSEIRLPSEVAGTPNPSFWGWGRESAHLLVFPLLALDPCPANWLRDVSEHSLPFCLPKWGFDVFHLP